ncbi:MAG: imidazole glycerol phosphate synthase subunit HisH [Deltaproteobacteria bacterium]|nr:imidazole glycerol phosphate synthase subunit HisH [Deltaproteobacteria bacterium]MBW1986287.1 imidazole glycerol phosphate synthase subunit HisH [Deltaproteobacteria bacterium]
MIVIIDYEAGNLASVKRSLSALGAEAVVTQDPQVVTQAERLIFPGVGAAGQAMDNLRRWGLDQALRQAFETGTPILGICLGAQIILDFSEENEVPCLGLLPGRVRALARLYPGIQGESLKIPHMGWNEVDFLRPHPVFQGLPNKVEFYFVHSFYPAPAVAQCVLGVTTHGEPFPSALGSGNLVATQFHPEKSGRFGLAVLKNFLAWDGTC